MPLTCELGWHSPDPLARWNHGYYFSKCTRCGRDLVRTAYSGWKVPKGVRVVWQAEPPPGWQSPDLVPAASAGEAAPDADAAPATALQEPHPAAAPAPPPEEVQAEAVSASTAPAEQIAPETANEQAPALEDVEPALAQAAEPAPDVPAAEAAAPPAETEAQIAAEAGGEDEPELPIMAVLRDLSATPPEADSDVTDVPDEEQAAPAAEDSPPNEEEPELAFAEVTPPPPRRSVVDDFMNEEPSPSWQPPQRAAPEARPAPALEQPEPCFRAIAAEEAAPPADSASASEADAAGEFDALPEFRGPAPADEREEAEAAGDKPQIRRPAIGGSGWWLAGAGAAAAAVLVLLPSFPGRDQRSPAPEEARANPQLIESPPAEAPPSPAPNSAAPAPRAETTYVAAPILNCRTAPAEQAPSARKLPRGAELKVLGREPEWVSVSHDGRQCWVAGRYVSPDKPL